MNKKIDTDILKKFQDHLKSPKTTMTPEKLADLKKRVCESLSLDRQKLLVRQPFTGGMLMRMEFVPTRDYRISTAMTDGNRIFFDIDFYKRLNEHERVFVLAHEIWHVVYMHFLRRQNRDQMIFNIATDCEINYMLSHEGFNPPSELCFPDREVEGQSAEEIYEYLLKKFKKQQKQKQNDGNNSKNGSGGNNQKKSSGRKNGKLEGQFDNHADGDETQDASCNGDGEYSLPTDEWGEKGEDPDYNPQISPDVAEKIREAIISEAQRVERQKGTLPGCVQSIVEKLRSAEIPWSEVLAQFVTSCLGDKRVWLPPQRRGVWSGTYLQSRRGQKINVSVIVDTSGSTFADLPKFMTELVSLLSTFGRYEMHLIQCDSKVQDFSTYDDCNQFPIDSCNELKWKGFGGSDLNPAFDELLKMNLDVSMNIVFTDGYINCPKENPLNCPTLFVLTTDGHEDLCDWGQKLKFKEKSDYNTNN